MKILVLGGTGYLGSNIISSLSGKGHDITCIVRPSSQRGRLKASGSIKFIMNDLKDIEEELSANHYEWVINSACVYRQSASLYRDMIGANLTFPADVLNLAAKYHVNFFMTMGTSLPGGFNMYSFTKSKLSELGRYFSEHEGMINFAELKLEMFYGELLMGGGVLNL